MGRRRTLNGLPDNLVKSFFSTLSYYDQGYMACWIWKCASEIKITELEIDIINGTTNPPEMKTKPIVAYLGKLRNTIIKTLTSNNFEPNFINNAKFKIWISKKDNGFGDIYCQGIVEDIEGKVYEGNVYQEPTYPIADSFLEKILENNNIKCANNDCK